MKKKKKPIWAKNIFERRQRLGFDSAEAFAEEIGVPYPTYRDIEGGVSEGRFDTREQIAKALKCTIADLYKNPTDINNGDFASAAEFLSTFANLPLPYQKVILALAYKNPMLVRDIDPELGKPFQALLSAL